MNHRFELPSMGEGVFEATIVRWLKDIGAAVKKDEPILEVSTDKVDTEIVSPQDGYLIASFAQPGSVVRVGSLVGQIAADPHEPAMTPSLGHQTTEAGHATKISGPTKVLPLHPASHSSSSAPVTRRDTMFLARAEVLQGNFAGRIRSSPLVRRIARESGVPLADVPGSGLHGRITKNDLLSFLSDSTASAPRVAVAAENPLHLEQRSDGEYLEGVKVKRQTMDRIRRLTAEHMTRSVRTSPHVTTTFAIDMTRALELQKAKEASFAQKHGGKLTLTALFVMAAARALKEHPMVNASIDGTDILLKDDINIGCAVATPQGLMVPVLKGVQDLDLEAIAVRLNSTVRRARSKELKPEDITGGTFTITNPGIYGSVHSQPIISQPQVAIMSVGAMETRLKLEQGQIVETFILQCGLTFDHRIIDGEGGAKFLKTVKETLEGL